MFDFSGRVDRELYWHGLGLVWTTVLAVAAFAAARGGEGDAGLTVAMVIISVAPLWPEMALMSKRLHDMGLPGFLCVLDLVPVLGTALTILLGLPPGRKGPNRHGPSPG